MKNLLTIQLNLGTLEYVLEETLQAFRDFEKSPEMVDENENGPISGRTVFAIKTRNLRNMLSHAQHELTIDKEQWEWALGVRAERMQRKEVAV